MCNCMASTNYVLDRHLNYSGLNTKLVFLEILNTLLCRVFANWITIIITISFKWSDINFWYCYTQVYVYDIHARVTKFDIIATLSIAR